MKYKFILFVCALLTTISLQADIFTIDPLNVAPASNSFNGVGDTFVQNGTNVGLFTRNVLVTQTDQLIGNSEFNLDIANVIDTSAPSFAALTTQLTYITNDAINGVNVQNGDNDAVRLNFIFFDLANFDSLTLVATDVAGNTATNDATTQVNDALQASLDVGDTDEVVDLLFADFVGDAVDFSQIDSLVFTFDGGIAQDFTIQFLDAVPEPSTYAILGLLGVLSLLKFRRKKATA